MPQKIIVASQNPVKINAIQRGFEHMFYPETFKCTGVNVLSGVSNQPMGDKETLFGAMNRVKNAKKQFPDADYWAGIEGGIQKAGGEMQVFAWLVICSETTLGKARTGTFFLPPKMVTLINGGKELGEASDIIFNEKNSKQKNGSVGILTEDNIDRTEYYVHAAILALIPFKNSELYGM